jgi:hypothetical protein
MPDSFELILLVACAGFLFMIFLMAVGIRSSLGRIERLLAVNSDRVAPQMTPAQAEAAAGGAFDAFLSEDPARKELTKKEQSAAYRKWRQQNGMNWSNS